MTYDGGSEMACRPDARAAAAEDRHLVLPDPARAWRGGCKRKPPNGLLATVFMRQSELNPAKCQQTLAQRHRQEPLMNNRPRRKEHMGLENSPRGSLYMCSPRPFVLENRGPSNQRVCKLDVLNPRGVSLGIGYIQLEMRAHISLARVGSEVAAGSESPARETGVAPLIAHGYFIYC